MNDIYTEVLQLLEQTHERPADICRAVNVSPRWLARLKAGDYDDPGVKKMQRLHAHLTAANEPSHTGA